MSPAQRYLSIDSCLEALITTSNASKLECTSANIAYLINPFYIKIQLNPSQPVTAITSNSEGEEGLVFYPEIIKFTRGRQPLNIHTLNIARKAVRNFF